MDRLKFGQRKNTGYPVFLFLVLPPAGIKIVVLTPYSKGFSISFGQYLVKKILFFYEH